MFLRICVHFLLLLLFQPVQAEVLIPLKATWRYQKGTAEASIPSNQWRELQYDDSGWLEGPATFYYGRNLAPGTTLPDMQNSYSCIFLRKSFNLPEAAEVDRLALKVRIDDGFIAWINGTEVARFNMNPGDRAFDDFAVGTINPTWVTNSLNGPAYLRDGANILCFQVFNRSLDSSDIAFDAELVTTIDRIAPYVTQVTPAPGTVSALTTITVVFNELVQGVDPGDLLINNQPARSVSVSGAAHTFTFDQPAVGVADIRWDAGHFITDLADPPHPFDETAGSANWSYVLKDEVPPTLVSVNPPAGSRVRSLSTIELRASEELLGLDAGDLLINGKPATKLEVRAGGTYLFTFDPPGQGPVLVTWSSAHQITDTAVPPNSFDPGSWTYEIDPSLPAERVIISEFLASSENPNGYKDEDGELQDWIELHNTGNAAVNLAGWSLTDDSDEPDRWIFPDISIPANGRLVVFASGKNRRETTPGARLHTNFGLNGEGEYLALFNADSPRTALSEFVDGYPEQRNDYSYGIESEPLWRYFAVPTPGQPNGSSAISGIVATPQATAARGLRETPFDVELVCERAGATIRYTLDGSVPTSNSGQIYSNPLRISNTTTLRAAAFLANELPSRTVTYSWIFLDDVLRQPNNPPGFPAGPAVFTGYPSDYEMDREIVDDPAYSGIIKEALAALPIISIVMKVDDMFGAANGIYTHPLNRGPAWEKPCSVEFFQQDGKGFQVNAGIQIQGNAAREPIKNPKHPMRVVFKGEYGPTRLNYRIFPDSPVDSFDTLILRADFNNQWLHWNPAQRIRGQRTRDAWMKDTMREMGGLASHNRYVHLYINGLYWGIYDPTERPDGSFGEAYLGGEKEDYDVINEGAVVDGSMSAYNTLINMPAVSDMAQYELIKQRLDMPQFIDYMLLHFFVGHEDWGNNKNWYTIRPKNGAGGFKYVPWDGEMILGSASVNRVSNGDVPSGLHTKLSAFQQYKMDFADHVHRHFFNNGALMPDANKARWLARAREIELPIVAESARWGDYRRDVHQYQNPPYELYTRDVHWRAEQRRLLENYFPARTSTVLGQLRAAGLYPQLAAPAFSQHGGTIVEPVNVTINGSGGTIYYTTNGVDPRVYGSGTVSIEAKPYSGPITVLPNTVLRARAFSAGQWSALNEAQFRAEDLRFPLRITEIMYNPPGDEYEYIELRNFSVLPLDASGLYVAGVDYSFPPRTILEPGQIIVLAPGDNPANWQARYGVAAFGWYDGQLVNRGERLALMTGGNQTVFSIDYSDDNGWPEEADGAGFALHVVEPFADPDDPANWHAATPTPGAPAPPRDNAAVRLSEISTTPSDWIELVNDSDQVVDLSGWRISDKNETNQFSFPNGSLLPGGGRITVAFSEDASGLHVARFGLDANNETIILTDPDGRRVDALSTGPLPAGYTIARVEDKWRLAIPTPGDPNIEATTASPASLRINEWLANSAPGQQDWLEVYNLDAARPAVLTGLFIETNGERFEITSHAAIGAGSHVRFWADEEAGPNHLDLKLPAGGGTIALFSDGSGAIDTVDFGGQPEGISMGRFPDGGPTVVSFPVSPTPGTQNALGFKLQALATSSEFSISWPSVVGRRYALESSETLSGGDWERLMEQAATETVMTAKEIRAGSRKYYRVIALPQ